MTLHHLPVPEPTETPDEAPAPDEAPPGFAALLRANLPGSPQEFLPFVVIALVLRFFAKTSWGVSAAVAAALIPVAIIVFAAGTYIAARISRRRAGDGDEEAADGR